MSYISEILQMLNQFPWLFITYVTILGLLVGSFLNVVIYRLPIMMENSFKDEYEEYIVQSVHRVRKIGGRQAKIRPKITNIAKL